MGGKMGKLQRLLATTGHADMRDPMLAIGMMWFQFQLFRLYILFLLFPLPLVQNPTFPTQHIS